MLRGTLGVALGSGGSRGFAHIGVLRELMDAGIEPKLVCGSSAGAIVGAVYAAGRLAALEQWARQLDRRQIMGLLDVSMRGGALRGRRMIDQIGAFLPKGPMETSLEGRFAAVATDLENGREIWLREGELLDVLHASSAVPGVISPVRIGDRWLVDGGIVNPVPVSLCRALGADTVIAVDLNAALLVRRFRGESVAAVRSTPPPVAPSALHQAWTELRQRLVGSSEAHPEPESPGFYDVLNNTLEIMEVRITRSRMAGDPPELLVTPRLPDFAFFDLHRAAEAIEAGRKATQLALASLGRGADD
jgi:NTE family protein